MNSIVVAVDGPAGSGKSSVSKQVALKKNLQYIDSGALYRCVTLAVVRKFGVSGQNLDYNSILQSLELKQQFNSDGSCSTFLNGDDVSVDIRNENITSNIGYVADNLAVRQFVSNLLRKWGQSASIIMDGRDIGTEVLPNANLKIYLDASSDERARRRTLEYQNKGIDADFLEIKKSIEKRDVQDKNRSIGKLIQADDAIYLDTSNMSVESVINRISELIDAIKY